MRINGIGTMFLGAQPTEQPSQKHATLWFTLFFAPIVPLRRARLELLPHRGTGFSARELERTPLVMSEVLRTYAFGWVVFPALLFGPFLLIPLREAVGLSESFQIPSILVPIAWLCVAAWRGMDWHEGRFHLGKR